MANSIYDLDGSKEKLQMLRQLLNLQVEVDVLKDLLIRHRIIDSLEFDAARNYIMQNTEYKSMYDMIQTAESQINHYENNPTEYLRDLMNRKFQGKD